MTSRSERTFSVGGLRVTVSARCHTLRYLGQFYPSARDGGVRIEVTASAPSRMLPEDENNYGVRTARLGADWVIWGGSEGDRAITARKLMRRIWATGFLPRPVVALHASAFLDGGGLVIILGDRGAGKTTLLLDALIHHECKYVSNDVLLAWCPMDSIAVVGNPTYIRVKRDSRADLVAWAERRVVDGYGEMSEGCIELVPASVPRWTEEPINVGVSGHVFVIRAQFAEGRRAHLRPLPGPAAPHLARFVRSDRSVAEYLDATAAESDETRHSMARSLADRIGQVLSFCHTGTVEPLLSQIRARANDS